MRAGSSSAGASCFQDFGDVFRDGGLQLPRLGVQGFEFLVERFEWFLEVLVADGFAGGHARVAAAIEADERRKMRPRTGAEYSCDFRPELARN